MTEPEQRTQPGLADSAHTETELLQLLGELHGYDRALKYAGAPENLRLHTIGDDAGRFVYQLAVAAQARHIVEVGGGAGHSTAWLALAASITDGRVTSIEREPLRRQANARLLARFGLDGYVSHDAGDALEVLTATSDADFYLLDGAKAEYPLYLDAVLSHNRSAPTVVVADNCISHRLQLTEFLAQLASLDRVSHLLVPVGKGLEFILVEGAGEPGSQT